MKVSRPARNYRHRPVAAIIAVCLLGMLTMWAVAEEGAQAPIAQNLLAPETKPALTVATIHPRLEDWPQTVVANGNVVAWQEAVIGSELNGFQLTEVMVNVGDVVRKGQLLARISSDTVQAELEQSKAAVVEAEATLAEARANADRARQVAASGALSAQQINQYLTAEQTVLARVNAARARVQADALRVSQTRLLAPDDGIISARTATVGSLTQPGHELFRLIRGNRLEWHAEVTATELSLIKPGMGAALVLPGGERVQGKVRVLAPTVDEQTRNAVVYVDLPVNSPARAGMFARGEFELGKSQVLTLPQSAVLVRDGFSYVYRVDAGRRALQVKTETGRRIGERIEIISGLAGDAAVIASGGGFLADGDIVRVVDAADAPSVTVAQ